MKMLQEFKQFVMRGNVLDMAIGIVIGAAFGKIVSSLVSDVLLPPIGLMVGGVDFSDLAITLKSGADGSTPVLLKFGVFINTILDFIIVAFAIFLLVKGVNTLKKKEKEKPSTLIEPTKSEVLLAEIRDELRKR
ncbi:MAG: large-conductance mechanosensitive channel protein MscL [Ignavibacteriales bacterium]